MYGDIVLTINAVSVLAVVGMRLWKGWGVFDANADFDKRGWLVLGVIQTLPLLVFSYIEMGQTPDTLSVSMLPGALFAFLLIFSLNAGVFVVLPAMLTDCFILSAREPQRRSSPPDDDQGPRRPRPRRPDPSQDLTPEQRKELYAKLGVELRSKTQVD